MVTDNYDENLAGLVLVTGTVNMNQPGEYTLVYEVSDHSGNTGRAERIVQVISNDSALYDLNLNEVRMSPPFSPEQLNYNVDVGEEIQSII